MIKTCELLSYSQSDFAPVFSAANMEIYPYQIAAAQFALQIPSRKGAILCDEGSLGKTYEALLVAAQKFFHGYERQLLILPANLLFQWREILENALPLPYHIWEGGQNLPTEAGLIITTYQHALKQHETISQNIWDPVIFEEANILAKLENKITSTLKIACQGAFKLLLTPTPITMSIMDIYGLIHFIDESVLPDADHFYKRYFRKSENYPELSEWVSQFAFRTLKKQVTNYVNFTRRLAFMLTYELSQKEQEIYDKLAVYLACPDKQACPKIDLYDLTLMLYHILASCPQAIHRTIVKL
ncbi:SNF2-related protein [Bartonella sp. DGB2]|uniref:SNF2-related protein n=1 Tax=Bartonella sp. DGB2 TaxID=3388426 RepID=UPI00398FA951